MIPNPQLPKPSPVWPPLSLPISQLPSLPCPLLISHWPPMPQPVMSLSHFLDLLPDGSFLPPSTLHLHSPPRTLLGPTKIRLTQEAFSGTQTKSFFQTLLQHLLVCPSQPFLHPEEFISCLSPLSEPVSSPVGWSVCHGGL